MGEGVKVGRCEAPPLQWGKGGVIAVYPTAVPPVHAIAERIAKIHNLKVEKIRRKLTEVCIITL